MTTLAIPPQRVRLYRQLWDRWIIVLRILFDLGGGMHPVKWQAVADTLLIDKKTAKKYLMGLVRDGHLALAGEAYMLTSAGMDMLQDVNAGGELFPTKEGIFPGENFSPLKESVVVVNSDLKQLTTTTPTESGKIPGEIFSPDVKLALEHVSDLFDGANITFHGLPKFLHIEKVLGWIAYVYDKRSDMNRPVGVLHSKLRDENQSPYTKYVKAPGEFLPATYMDAIGRFETTCDRCQVTFISLAEFEAHKDACLFTQSNVAQYDPDAGRTLSVDDTITPEIQRSWERSLEQLRLDMPKAAFETWVRDAVPVHVDEHGLQVAARNTYARDWLGSHVRTQLSQLLGQPVMFVVATETEAE